MDKQEFINRLRATLNGEISAALVTENVNYYEDYINTQIRMGKSEEEVLAVLGDPRLIARSIIDASGQTQTKEASYQQTQYQQAQHRQSAGYGDMYGNDGYGEDIRRQSGGGMREFRMPRWLWIVLSTVAVVLVVTLVVSVLNFLMPVLLVMAVVAFMTKLFRDWLN